MSVISAISTPTKRLSVPALIMTSFFALGVNVVWLSYNIYILPVQVEAVTSEATKGIVLGVLVGVAIGIAVIVNIVAGILSDHSSSRYGRRRPTLVVGMLLTLPFLLIPQCLSSLLWDAVLHQYSFWRMAADACRLCSREPAWY